MTAAGPGLGRHPQGWLARVRRRLAAWPLLRQFGPVHIADEAAAGRFRARQLQALLRLTPPAMVANFLNALLVVGAFWSTGPRLFLLVWGLLMGGFAVRGLVAWRRSVSAPPRPQASVRALRRATMNAALLAGLWAAAPMALFPDGDGAQQLLIGTVTTGMICAGAFGLAAVPAAGIAYVAVLGGGAAVALFRADVRLAPLIGTLLLIYCLIVMGSVWSTARMLGARLLAEADAERARQVADAASQAKSRFLARVSHELRTPLNAILGFTRLLRAEAPGAPLTAQHLHQLRVVDSSAQHLLALVEDLLDLSRIEAGEMNIELEDVDVVKRCRQAIDELQPQAQQASVTLRADYALPRMWVRGDALRITQVLLNLLSNAIKYNRPAGQVQVNVREGGPGWVTVAVQDTGRGLSAEQLAQLFQPFNRLGAERLRIPGVGVGLAITRQLVRLMHGDVAVQSRPGEGSCFTLSLPAGEAPLGPFPDSDLAPLTQPAGEGAVKAELLYVEDDAVNVLLFEAVARRQADWVVHVAADGAEALARLANRRFDIVVVDLNLPDMTGIELLAMARARPGGTAMPAVCLSADATDEARRAALRAGFAEYWMKPIDPNVLASGIRRVLADRGGAVG
jgi:signal transduction histidine kinase/CheY-like chemotaxis protein